MLIEYINILLFFFILLFVALTLLIINYLFLKQNIYLEKISAYECGFQPFEHSISDFDIRYYLIAILFLVFDLELIFLLPLVIFYDNLTAFAVFFVIYFFFLLIIGFYYEWRKKGLEWD